MSAQLPYEKPSPGMILVKWYLHVGFCGAKRSGSFEMPDTATNVEVDRAIEARARDHISFGLTRIVR